MELIHERLRLELEARGLSAAQAARDAGEPDSQGLRDVLAGRKRLSAELLGALSLRAGIDGCFVLTGERNQGTAEVDLLPADERVLVDAYRRCNPEAKRNLIQTAALLSAGLPGAPARKAVQGGNSVHIGGAVGSGSTVFSGTQQQGAVRGKKSTGKPT